MVAVGRALIGGTKLLLVDEVTQGLAPNIAMDMGRTLRRVADEGHGCCSWSRTPRWRSRSPTACTWSTRA